MGWVVWILSTSPARLQFRQPSLRVSNGGLQIRVRVLPELDEL
jgi:hypothetical protein